MRSRKHEVADIVAAVRAIDEGESTRVVCEKWGISRSTLYEWRGLYRDVPMAVVAHLEQLRRENAELKRQLGRIELDRAILMKALRHQNAELTARCTMASWLLKHCRISVARACQLSGVSRTLFISRSVQGHQSPGE